MKLLSLLRRNISRIAIIIRPHLQSRTLTFSPIHQQSPLLPEIYETIASVHSISSNPFFSLLGLCKNISSLKTIHSLLVVHGLAGDLLFQTKLVSLYGLFAEIDSARLVFDRIPNPGIYSYKVMIRWYFLNDLYSEIIEFYICMTKCLREQDNVVFSIVLKACSELHDVDEGRKVHCRIVKVGSPDSFVLTGLVDIALPVGSSLHAYSIKEGLLSSSIHISTALVNLYAKCGDAESARIIFDGMGEKNRITWAAMIGCYGMQGNCSGSVSLFNDMLKENLEPNEVIFTITETTTVHAQQHTGENLAALGSFAAVLAFGLP
ncbi:hypothetical protein U1Q18_048809 [Sarracenia purpurea var. burkii]